MSTVLKTSNYIWMSEHIWGNMIYVLSIALQLAAGLLLIGNTATSKAGIVKAYRMRHTTIVFKQDDNLEDYSGLQDVIKTTWINKIAFFYLFAGYLTGIWGEVPTKRTETFLIILFLMAILVVIPCKFAKYKSERFGKITEDDILLQDKNTGSKSKKCIIKKKINKGRFIFWTDFFKENRGIAGVGVVVIVYCIVCVFFKSSTKLNVNVSVRPWADFLFNIAISVIAAVVFYIVQVYVPNRKREQVLRKYAKRYIKEVLIKECNLLKVRTDLIYNGQRGEKEIQEAIDSSCKKVKNALNESLNCYLSVLSDDLIDAINSVLFDDMLYELGIRACGILKNESLEKIVANKMNYHCLWERVEKVKNEVEKM